MVELFENICFQMNNCQHFFSDYDEVIAVAKKELELWKKLKKGQQQMFV